MFDTLYLLLSFGHESAEEAERLDPPFSYFRIRLVCSLLETCGQFFNKGLAKKRLDRFLAFYQRYLLAKPPLPLDVEFDVQVCPHRPACLGHSQSCFDASEAQCPQRIFQLKVEPTCQVAISVGFQFTISSSSDQPLAFGCNCSLQAGMFTLTYVSTWFPATSPSCLLISVRD